MDDVNPYQPPQEQTIEPSVSQQRLTRKGFLPFVAGMGVCMTMMFTVRLSQLLELGSPPLEIALLSLAVIGFTTAFMSVLAYGWLRFRVGKYGYWKQSPVVLFFFGLLFYPAVILSFLAIFFGAVQIVPTPLGEAVAPIALISSLFTSLELLRFLSQRHIPPQAGP